MTKRTPSQTEALARVLGDAETVASQHKGRHTEAAPVAAADKRAAATAVLSERDATRIVRPYVESDSKLASMVTTLTPFTGKGWSADGIIDAVSRALPAESIPSAFSRSTVSNALTAARAMAGIEIAASASARDGIAAALLRIVRYRTDVGGAVKGMRAALDAALEGTDNAAEVAERLTHAADTVAEADSIRRRAPKVAATRAAHGRELDAAKPEPKPAPAAGEHESKTVKGDTLAAASVSSLIAALATRLSSASKMHPDDVAAFDALAVVVESLAFDTVDA